MADRSLTLTFLGKDVSASATAEALAAKLKVLEAAQDDNTRASDRFSKSLQDTHSKGFKPLLDSATLLGPALVPIGAAAVAAGVGFAGLGAAGILAFTGIKREMQEGTPLGQQYTAAFKPVVDEFHTLQTISAAGVFSGINRGITDATTLFPGLNREIGLLSIHLGDIGGNVGATFVNLFRQAEPLFQGIAEQLDRGSGALLRWSQSSDGPSKFIAYAQQQLPQVETLIKNLAVDFGHIAQAAAPLGGVVLDAFSALAAAIAKIPVPVLTGLLLALQASRLVAIAQGLGLLGAGAEVAAGGLTGLAAAGSLLPPVAVAMTAIAVAAELMHGSISQHLPQVGVNINNLQRDVKKASDDTATSMTSFGASIEKAYAQGGDGAKQLAFQAAVTSDTVVGEVSTMTMFAKTNMTGFALALTGTDPGWQQFKHNALDGALAAGLSGKSVADLGLDIDAIRQKFIDGKISGDEEAAALKAIGVNADGSTAPINNLTDAQLRGKDAADAQKQSIMGLTAEISKFQSQAIGAQNTQLGLNDALAHAKENTDKSSGSLSANTDAGRKNQGWVLDQIGKINQLADATLQQTGSTAQASASLKTNEDALRRAASAAGLNAGEVDKLIQQYGNVPANVTTYLRTVDGASGVIRGVDGMLRALDGRVVYTTITTQHLDIFTVQDAASNRGPAGVTAKQHGGFLGEGWNIVNEAGPEWMFKSGPNVMVYPSGRGPAGVGGSGVVNVHLEVHGSVVSEKDLVRTVAYGLDDLRRRRGRGSVLDG